MTSTEETAAGALDGQTEPNGSGSDADTDEMLTNADIFCSGASEKQRNDLKSMNLIATTPIKSASHASSPSSKSSVRRSLNFDVDKVSSERKRQLKSNHIIGDESDNADRSQSCPSTPKSESNAKINLKKITFSPLSTKPNGPADEDHRIAEKRSAVITPISIPLNSYALVQFSTQLDDDDQESEEGSISEKRVEYLRSLLDNAKIELTNASQLIVRAMNSVTIARPFDSSTGSIPTSLSVEERSFLERLSAAELRELYEAEFCKRQYCEKKIDILQKQLLDLEQKLSVATVVLDRYKNVVSTVDQSCTEFIADISAKEKERKRKSILLKESNDQLKNALERVIGYGQALGEKLESANERIRALEKDSDTRMMAISNLELENGKLKDESSNQQSEINALRKKFDQSESKRKILFDREEQLTKELLATERAAKENSEMVQKLKNELNNEKSMRRQQLDEKERQYKERLADLGKEFDARVEKNRHDIEQRTASEMKKLRDEWDTMLYGLHEKYGKVVGERDEALKRLKEYEDTFMDRQRVMCYELQQRLSAKYYELLSEFNPGLSASNNGNPDPPSEYQMVTQTNATAIGGGGMYQSGVDPTWFSSSMADEFLERLRNAYPPGSTPRHLRNEAASKEHGQTKQQVSSGPSNQRACPPPDGYSKKK